MPVLKKVFSEAEQWALDRCAKWNCSSNLADVAWDMLENGPEFGTVQWNEVGHVFVKFFGKPDSLCCTAKRDWETIGNIAYKFGRTFRSERDRNKEGVASA
jgi:hypothetical protein